MRHRLALMAACLLGLIALWGSVSPGQPPAVKAAAKWEYKSDQFAGNQDDRLNRMGEQGWELVAVTGDGPGQRYVFKRPKP
ncbi:hypothetical protein OJF2_34580 [Aquisphaera giovannonii]|uniref:DUF4177 domain-containing protein n=1 Tax=Aquisphaera giovannonii TaxID=406548 RepID=A0A5B9W2R9_9BACT|nr:DUF4177 domain-containing protein [Aquisphaera giovannonii]QEH34913.1 hypothetical protein OJF2_34580 [Aquisphaera giovannonii]